MGFKYEWAPTTFRSCIDESTFQVNVSEEPKWVYVTCHDRNRERNVLHFRSAEEFDLFISDLHEARKQSDY